MALLHSQTLITLITLSGATSYDKVGYCKKYFYIIFELYEDGLLIELRHDKMCLQKFPARPDTNRPAQPQKLARVLKFPP